MLVPARSRHYFALIGRPQEGAGSGERFGGSDQNSKKKGLLTGLHYFFARWSQSTPAAAYFHVMIHGRVAKNTVTRIKPTLRAVKF